MLRRRVPLYLDLTMLLGAWHMSEGDDFAALWGLTSFIVDGFRAERAKAEGMTTERPADA